MEGNRRNERIRAVSGGAILFCTLVETVITYYRINELPDLPTFEKITSYCNILVYFIAAFWGVFTSCLSLRSKNIHFLVFAVVTAYTSGISCMRFAFLTSDGYKISRVFNFPGSWRYAGGLLGLTLASAVRAVAALIGAAFTWGDVSQPARVVTYNPPHRPNQFPLTNPAYGAGSGTGQVLGGTHYPAPAFVPSRGQEGHTRGVVPHVSP